MKTHSTQIETLGRVDERIQAIHEYIINEIRPALKDLACVKESVRWLKAGVFGVYGLLGSALLALIAFLLK
jgi:hypothetical protein